MKILSARQTKELDAFTIQQEGIDSIELMERAAQAFVNWFIERFDKDSKIKIFCGPGNNGGDGLAISRLLIDNSYYEVRVYSVASGETSSDFKVNKERLKGVIEVASIDEEKSIPSVTSDEIVIDAIFGSGLTRPVTGIYDSLIDAINTSGAFILSVDIASGLFCDQVNTDVHIIQPDYTISFQFPKISFLLPMNEKFTGQWVLVDIGLNKEFIAKVETDYYFTDSGNIREILKPRSKFSHKGNFGKALIMAGSYGMMGAAVLTSKACLRTGVGLCISYVPECGYEIMQTSVPENMVLTDKETDCLSDVPDLSSYNAIAIGPGIANDPKTVSALKALLEKVKVPLVIDADGLNIISENRELLKRIPEGSILTPHPKEFERLAGKSADDYERLELLKSFSKEINSYVILKGAHTAIGTPQGDIYFNSTGNPGMATGGSGDVLTGIITSLLAQGYSSLEAAILGVYMHGYAGDVAANQLSEPSMIASDIINGISAFYKDH